tara:strand:- start:73 stop:564 length:492 start_codon:yes stop_codon:yes gene_type:complete
MVRSYPIKVVYAVVLFVSFFISGGCSNKYRLTFNTNPQGATLICDGKNWGYTPVQLYLPEEVRQKSYIDGNPCVAHWASGAKASYHSQVAIYPSAAGTILNLDRPPGPGYEIDAEFNLKLQQMQYQKRSLEAAERAAAAAEDSAFQNSLPVSCFSYAGITTCN